MDSYGFHCSHEQHSPSALLEFAKLAEECGFSHAMCSDHFHPWSEAPGESGFAWSWLGSALEATALSLGTVCAPGQRYHAAVIAQAIATLSEMYEGRLWVALGSGEALNESITGTPWPNKQTRNQRLRESLLVIRRLLGGETVNFKGTFSVKDATLFTLPKQQPLLLGAALTPETATWMAPLFDGLITAGSDREGLAEILRAFRENGGQRKPVYLQTALSYASTKEEALRIAHGNWRHAALVPEQLSSLATPKEFDAATADISPEELQGNLRISDSLNEILDATMADKELGFDRVFLHYLGEDVSEFITAAGQSLSD